MFWNVMNLGLAAAHPGDPATALSVARTRSRNDRGINVLLDKGRSTGRTVAVRSCAPADILSTFAAASRFGRPFWRSGS
jgi:hypothetical protein